MSPDALECLARYHWPGNVRELQNEIRRAAVLCDGIILESHLSESVRHPRQQTSDGPVPVEKGTTLPDMVRDLEMCEIQKSLEQAGGNKSRAADMLGLSRFALQRKLEKYGLEPGKGDTGKSSAPVADEGTGTGCQSPTPRPDGCRPCMRSFRVLSRHLLGRPGNRRNLPSPPLP